MGYKVNIQSLSVCVPNTICINNCKFCCSNSHSEKYNNDGCISDFHGRLEFARDNGCNVAILTGGCEPIQQYSWLIKNFANINKELKSPFKWIEIQTTGVKYNPIKYYKLGVTTVSLSIADIFDDNNSFNIQGTPCKERISLQERCSEVIKDGFNLRICLNMTDRMSSDNPKDIIERCADLGAYALTARELFCGKGKKGEWCTEHKISLTNFNEYVRNNGFLLEELPYYKERYSVHGVSVVVDCDCMDKNNKTNDVRYLILRPDGRLYSKWDDKASLLF
jgi:hypothetical protein